MTLAQAFESLSASFAYEDVVPEELCAAIEFKFRDSIKCSWADSCVKA
jgi:hypothetical protein